MQLSVTTSTDNSFIIRDPKEVLKHVGEIVTVEGCVVSANLKERVKGKPIFLDMFAAYPDNLFAVAIWEIDQHKFLPAVDYHQKMVRVTGHLKKKELVQPGKANQDRVTIDLNHPSQITIIGDCPPGSRH